MRIATASSPGSARIPGCQHQLPAAARPARLHHNLLRRSHFLLLLAGLVLAPAGVQAAGTEDAATPDPAATARQADALIDAALRDAGVSPAPRTTDEDFLRRVSFDLTGRLPSPDDVTLFGINPDRRKRERTINRLVASPEFAANWSRYWRDVIFSRATDQRAPLARNSFETWMKEQLEQDRGWDKIATALITATGDVREEGATALIFAHGAEATEVAAETSRIFTGIQIQCANCHNHPTDRWTRDDFHTLAAYFPRIRIQRSPDANKRTFIVASVNAGRGAPGGSGQPTVEQVMRRLDRNRDGKLTKAEVKGTPLEQRFDQILSRLDADSDMALSRAEYEQLAMLLQGRNRPGEYFMPDLENPASPGTRIDPRFFVSGDGPGATLPDLDRREALAASITSPENPWFARAYVNRIWTELTGAGFYTPVDDIGPERSPQLPEVLELLVEGFVQSGHSTRWLFRTILLTEAWQRQVQGTPAGADTVPFAAASATRLRGDQVYEALIQVLGVSQLGERMAPPGRGPGALFSNERTQFNDLFGFDPSTSQADITGNVPQALFLMNSPAVHNLIRGDGNTRLGRILRQFDDDETVVQELYLLVLSREPTAKEIEIALRYRQQTGDRIEAFEDLMWSLLNSSEFLTRR